MYNINCYIIQYLRVFCTNFSDMAISVFLVVGLQTKFMHSFETFLFVSKNILFTNIQA